MKQRKDGRWLKVITVDGRRINFYSRERNEDLAEKDIRNIAEKIKKFPLEITGTRGFLNAQVTSGGVKVDEINEKTMESKICRNLYFAGEIIDVDAYTGGFNLQIAYSTGYTAGLNY